MLEDFPSCMCSLHCSLLLALQEAWSKRTHSMYLMLGEAFKESGNTPLSYDAMIAQTSSRYKRRIVAGCFQELLFLSTHGLIDLEQQRPYGNIVVSKTDHFDSIAAP